MVCSFWGAEENPTVKPMDEKIVKASALARMKRKIWGKEESRRLLLQAESRRREEYRVARGA